MKRLLFSFFVAVLAVLGMAGQEPASTLFAYPQAPDTCTSLESRCNYLVQHFWDAYDIRRPIAEPQKFETAMRDYVTFFKYANRTIVFASIRDFMFKARSNANNLLKVGEVAERVLYSPDAEYWSDEVYVEFARSLAETSTLKKNVRNYYRQQIERIEHNQPGAPMVDLELVDADGRKTRLSQLAGEGYLLVFTDDSSDSSIARLRLSTDVGINSMIESGGLTVVQIYVGKPADRWAASMPEKWMNTYCENARRDIDLRMLPCCYLIDKDRIILNKNIDIDQIKNAIN